jgi:hypothetical protein
MTTAFKKKLVTATAINMVVEVNQIMVENARKGKPASVQSTGIFNRAFMIYHENGVLPVADYLSEE